MKIKTVIAILILCISKMLSAQEEKINQFDSAGKKHGKWKRYLDAYWNVVDDTNKAVFWRYTFFDHGVNVHPMGAGGKKGWTMESDEKNPSPGKIKMLNGVYTWRDKKGRVIYEHVLLDGVYVSYKEFFKSGKLQTHFDYNKHAEGQPLSWYITVYNESNKIVYEGFTKKNEKGEWPKMRG